MSNRIPNDLPSPAEHATLRAALARLGCKPKDVDDAAGATHGGRTRRMIGDALKVWARTRPKG